MNNSRDIEKISASFFIPWEKLYDKNVLITGGTGLIGSTVADILLKKGVKVTIKTRDREKAEYKFKSKDVSIIQSIEEAKDISYVIHASSPVSSSYFLSNPVETIDYIYSSSVELLEWSKNNGVESFLFVSSLEAYGSHKRDRLIKETDEAYIDTQNPRSSYSEAKRISELLCASYAKEYRVGAKSVRLGTTFALEENENDKRLCPYLLSCFKNDRDIILSTDGSSVSSYIHPLDAATAILTVLLKGKAGEVYNASNKDICLSVKELANYVAAKNGKIKVEINKGENKEIYPPSFTLKLDTTKLENLGWKAVFSLSDVLTSWRGTLSK